MTLGNHNGTDGQTDGQTDRQSATQYAAPPREEGRIISLYSMRSFILSQCRDLRIWVTTEFGKFSHSPGKRVLNYLKTIYLRLWKTVVQSCSSQV